MVEGRVIGKSHLTVGAPEGTAVWRRKFTSIAAVAAVVSAAVLGFVPIASALSPASGGDPQLIALVEPILERGSCRNVGVAYVDASGVRFANFGATDDTEYEIGSVTKTFTAALFADAVARGEVSENTRLGDLVPLDGSPVAEVTLIELASHRSGLAPFALTPDMAAAAARWLIAENPFRFDREQLMAQARSAPLLTRGTVSYSTLGYALLGHAVAAAARTDYPTLLRERMLLPLGLSQTWLPRDAADLPTGASIGFDVLGRPQAAWPLDGYAPAGGLRSTLTDMSRYARLLLDGTVPGASAMDPRWPRRDGTRAAMSWTVTAQDGREYTMHSGGTGGFQSIIVLDRQHDRALVILANTIGGLERPALEILNALS